MFRSGKEEKSQKKFDLVLGDDLPPYWQAIKDKLEARIIGQPRAITEIIKRAMLIDSGMKDPNRPVDVLFFAGPSGSGKTFTAEVFSEAWLGAPDLDDEYEPMVKVSGENYTEEHAGFALSGSPPSYIGSDRKNLLEAIGFFDFERRLKALVNLSNKVIEQFKEEYRKKEGAEVPESVVKYVTKSADGMIKGIMRRFVPFRSVLLVDEFEKMHPTVRNQFLGILDSGRFQLLKGTVLDFRNCLIIFTSNIGTEKLNTNPLGFGPNNASRVDDIHQRNYETINAELKKRLDPALYSRIGHDNLVVFQPLSLEIFVEILDTQIYEAQDLLGKTSSNKPNIEIVVSSELKTYILSKADAPREGARQLARLVSKYIRDPLTRRILAGDLMIGDKVLFSLKKDAAGEVSVELKVAGKPGRHKPLRVVNRSYGTIDIIEEEMHKNIFNFFERTLEKYKKQIEKKQLEAPPSENN